MKAVVYDEIGAPPVIRDVPTPEPQPGEVRVKIRAAGVNPYDEKARMGAMQGVLPYKFPVTLGFDLAGTIDRVAPGVSRFQPGQSVFGEVFKNVLHDGSYAEYVTVSESAALAAQPRNLGAAEAAALPMAGQTALALVDAIMPQHNQTVLIVGATGGVGSYATQLVADTGARVIATARADEVDYVRRLGAAEVIDYSRQDVVREVRSAHPDGIDALIDTVNDAPGFARLAELVSPGGRAASTLGSADVDGLARRQITAVNANNPASSEALNRLAQLVDAGRLRMPEITKIPLEDGPKALEQYRTGHARGKTVLMVSE